MSTESTVALRPSEQRALEIWDALPSEQRSYKAVAALYTKADGSTITEGRASGYVREALTKSGRADELPTRGNGSTVTPTTHKAQTPLEMMKAAVETMRANIANVERRQADATEAAESFDPEAFKAAEETKLADAVKAAQAALKAWRDDADGAATKAAEAKATALRERAEHVTKETEATLEALRKDLSQYESAVALFEQTS